MENQKRSNLYNNKKVYLSYNGEIYNYKLIEKKFLKKCQMIRLYS